MSARWLADAVLLLHAAFVLFVVAGAALVAWRPWIAWIHLPAAAWGAFIEFSGRICPLTPLENRYRSLAGQAGFEGGFIEHYALAMLYPEGLTRSVQLALGLLVLLVNAVAYAWILYRHSTKRS
jgi:hypothetical protein